MNNPFSLEGKTSASRLTPHSFATSFSSSETTPSVEGLYTRINGKISVFTVLQYINKINNKPIDQIKFNY